MNKEIPLPKATRAWIISRLSWTDAVPTAGVSLQPGGYKVFINQDWWAGLTMEQRRSVLLHEIAHVWRGDCLEGEGRDPQTWNIATDAVINRTLGDLPGEPVRYEDTCKQAGLAVEIPYWSAKIIYDRLIQQQTDQGDSPDGGSPQHNGDPLAGDIKTGGDPVDHLKEKEALQGAMSQDGMDPRKELPGCAQPSTHKLAGQGTGTEQWSPKDRAVLALALELDRIIAKHRNRLTPCRTWRREGRIRLLRGSGRVPNPSVGVYLDLSGSTDNEWEQIGAIARGLKQKGADLFVFDDGVRPWDGSQAVVAGGGTAWAPVVEHIAQSGHSLVVVVTDGYFFDPVTEPGCETVWIVTPGGRRPAHFGRALDWPEG
jgi:predicted metal-dependent peptidase